LLKFVVIIVRYYGHAHCLHNLLNKQLRSNFYKTWHLFVVHWSKVIVVKPQAERGRTTETANKEVQREPDSCGKKRKWSHGDGHYYAAEIRAKIAKHASENGNIAAVLFSVRRVPQSSLSKAS